MILNILGISLESFPCIICLEYIETQNVIFKLLVMKKKKSLDILCTNFPLNNLQISFSLSSPLPKLTITSESRGDTPLQQNLYICISIYTHTFILV